MNQVLALLILQFAAALEQTTQELLNGDTDADTWEQDMLRIIALYLMLAMMLGLEADTLNEAQTQLVKDATIAQASYLEGFKADLAKLDVETDAEEILSRAKLYASSATEIYWRGNTWSGGQLILPAYPADGSAECLQFDKCAWELNWLDRDEGDIDAYWTLGTAEHCPTCLKRSEEWNPLRVRNWKYNV